MKLRLFAYNNLKRKMPRKIKVKYLNKLSKPWNVAYAAVKTDKFGDIQIGTLNGAICFLYFAPQNQLESAMRVLMSRYNLATFHENPLEMELLAKRIFSNQDDDDDEIEVLLSGTDFQNNVWEALLEIPEGEQWNYSALAEKMGKPSAIRAVANAVAKNQIAYLIPCHRVVSKNGNQFKYAWGAERKRQLLDYEAGVEE